MGNTRCIIFYFSGTGNTAWAARKMAEVLTQGGMPAEAHSIDGLTPEDAARLAGEAGHVAFGYPIYGSDVPQPMKDFLRRLPPLGLRTYVGFCTQEMFSGDGVRVMEPFLRNSQGPVRIAYARHINMPNNISIEKYGFKVEQDPDRIKAHFDKAEARISAFAKAILEGWELRQGMNLGSRMLGFIQRGPFRLMYPGLMGCMSIDSKKCSGCAICFRICPMGNIRMAEEAREHGDEKKDHADGHKDHVVYEAGRNCCLCLRCYNYCPENAVLFRGTRAKGKPYQGPEGTLAELLEKDSGRWEATGPEAVGGAGTGR